MLQISVGKLNQLINGSYEQYFIKRNKEEYLESRTPKGEFVTERAIKEYDELVKEWKQSSQNEELPTEDWLRERKPENIIPQNYKRVQEAWTIWNGKKERVNHNYNQKISDSEAYKEYIGDPEIGDY
jgi:hypothetical protein